MCFDGTGRQGRDPPHPGPRLLGILTSLHVLSKYPCLRPRSCYNSPSTNSPDFSVWGRMHMESSGQFPTSLDTLKTFCPGGRVGPSSACCPLSRPRLPPTSSPQPKPAPPRPLIHSPVTTAACATRVPRTRRPTTWTKKLVVFMLSGRHIAES